jgi:hypothetical protein
MVCRQPRRGALLRQEKLSSLGHFYTAYKNMNELKFKFDEQLDKLVSGGFVDLAGFLTVNFWKLRGLRSQTSRYGRSAIVFWPSVRSKPTHR